MVVSMTEADSWTELAKFGPGATLSTGCHLYEKRVNTDGGLDSKQFNLFSDDEQVI